jgi:hypothetical protein
MNASRAISASGNGVGADNELPLNAIGQSLLEFRGEFFGLSIRT